MRPVAFGLSQTGDLSNLAATDAAFLALEATRPVLAADITPTVEYFYRHDPDASSRRVKCARWGVVYSFAPNETPDPEEPEEPA